MDELDSHIDPEGVTMMPLVAGAAFALAALSINSELGWRSREFWLRAARAFGFGLFLYLIFAVFWGTISDWPMKEVGRWNVTELSYDSQGYAYLVENWRGEEELRGLGLGANVTIVREDREDMVLVEYGEVMPDDYRYPWYFIDLVPRRAFEFHVPAE